MSAPLEPGVYDALVAGQRYLVILPDASRADIDVVAVCLFTPLIDVPTASLRHIEPLPPGVTGWVHGLFHTYGLGFVDDLDDHLPPIQEAPR